MTGEAHDLVHQATKAMINPEALAPVTLQYSEFFQAGLVQVPAMREDYGALAAVLADHLPGLSELVGQCPDGQFCGGTNYQVWGLVQHLNDDHRWPREKIADWLESLDVDLSITIPDPPGSVTKGEQG